MSIAPGPESLALERLAAVIAAQGDAFDLEEILEIEGLDEEAWSSAKTHWMPRLAEEDTLRSRYDASLAESQQRLQRAVAPLDTELEAWVMFLKQCEAAGAEAAIDKHGMTMNDLARLQRKWQARFEKDAKLAEQAGKFREREHHAALAVTAEKRDLVPSPYATGSAASSIAVEMAPTEAEAPLSIDMLAAIVIEFSFGIELSESYLRYGFGTAEVALNTLASWQQQLEDDPALQDALQDAIDQRRMQPLASSQTPSGATHAPLPNTQPSAGVSLPAGAPAASAFVNSAVVNTGHFRSPWRESSSKHAPPSSASPRSQTPSALDRTAEGMALVDLPPLPFDATGQFIPVALTPSELAQVRAAAGDAGTTALAMNRVSDTLPFEDNPLLPAAGGALDESITGTALAMPALELDEPLPFEQTAEASDDPMHTSLDDTAAIDVQLLSIDELPFGDGEQPPTKSLIDMTGAIDAKLLGLDELPFEGMAKPARAAAVSSTSESSAPPSKLSDQLTQTRAIQAVSMSSLIGVPLPFAHPFELNRADASHDSSLVGSSGAPDTTPQEGHPWPSHEDAATSFVTPSMPATSNQTAPQRHAHMPPVRRRAKAATFVGCLPELTVEQYACYCAERDAYGHFLEQVRNRYNVPAEDAHDILALRWAARLAAHPEQYARYREAHQQYAQWLREQAGTQK